jgi:hypothetical protein
MPRKILKRILFLFLFWGCSTYQIIYDFELTGVDVSAYKNEVIKITKNEKGAWEYEDGDIKIIWGLNSKEIGFKLLNKTNNNIKVIWDEAIYIDENKRSRRLIHSGVYYLDRYRAQVPSVVAKNTYILESLYPADYIEVNPVKGEFWGIKPLFIDEYTGKLEKAKKIADGYIGQFIGILMFLIKDAEIEVEK